MGKIEQIHVHIEKVKSNGLIESTEFILRVGDNNTQYLKEIRELLMPADVISIDRQDVPLLKRPVGFGKYRTKTWEEVINMDPNYVQWAIDKVDKIKGELHQTITERLFEIKNDNEQFHLEF